MNRLYFLIGLLTFQILLFHNEVYSQPTKKQWKIAVLGAHNPTYDHIGQYSHLNKLAYAQKHGYGVHLYNENLSPASDIYWWPKTPIWWLGYWFKVVVAQKHLADYDWLFYLDSDAIIMNDSIKLESLIDDRYDIVATSDGGSVPILSGQFLIKNSKWSRDFLERWFLIGNNDIQPGFDGGALIQLFNETPNIHKHVKVIPIQKMGSYYWDYKEGDFAIQFAGMWHTEKAVNMKAYYEKLTSETK